MRKILLILATAGLAALTACDGSKPTPDSPIAITGGQTNQIVWADQTSGTGQVGFTTTASWTSSIVEVSSTREASPGIPSGTPASWVTISPSSGGAGNHNITITLDKNFSGANRLAAIVIDCDGETVTITVAQNGKTEEGEVPVDPKNQMKYVSSISITEESETETIDFEYDAQNRVTKMTYSEEGAWTFSYNDAARTVTVTNPERGEEHPVSTWTLNADGTLASADPWGNEARLYYSDGCLSRFTYDDDEEFTATWSGGNMTGVLHRQDEYPDVTITLSYNAQWPNNPKCNLDLNALIFEFDEIFSGKAELLGVVGKRSQHMIAQHTINGGYNEGTYAHTLQYDDDGFVKTMRLSIPYGGMELTITYR